MEIIIAVAIVLVLGLLTLFFKMIFAILEHNYGLLYNKVFYVHFYFLTKKLSTHQRYILENKFSYYQQLSVKEKKYFEHRVAKFVKKYQFIGNENFVITDEVRVLIAATSVLLTFGMRVYLYKVINKIIVYPSQYYSTINAVHHKGEFNPRMKAIVFSWEDFVEGFENKEDNLNLGLHEFTHVLHFNALKSDDSSATIFVRMFKKISKEINHEPNRNRLLSSNHFRSYAYTNQFEFIAVLIEHFFESPQEFKQEFPELFKNVSIMLNLKLIR